MAGEEIQGCARTEDEDEGPGTVAHEKEEHGRVAPAVTERYDKLVQCEEEQDRLECDKSDAVRVGALMHSFSVMRAALKHTQT